MILNGDRPNNVCVFIPQIRSYILIAVDAMLVSLIPWNCWARMWLYRVIDSSRGLIHRDTVGYDPYTPPLRITLSIVSTADMYWKLAIGANIDAEYPCHNKIMWILYGTCCRLFIELNSAYKLYSGYFLIKQLIPALLAPKSSHYRRNENTYGSYRPLIDGCHGTYHVASHMKYVCDFYIQ